MLLSYPQTLTVKNQSLTGSVTQTIVYGKKETEDTIDIKCHVAPVKQGNVEQGGLLHSKNIYLVQTTIANLVHIAQGSSCWYEGTEFVIYNTPVVYRNVLPHIEFKIVEKSGE